MRINTHANVNIISEKSEQMWFRDK